MDKLIIKRRPVKSILIYVLKDPTTEEIRYVGKTKRSLRQRLSEHVQQKPKDYRGRWIHSLLKQNLQPLIEEIKKCYEHEWQEREIFWIQYFRNLNCKLTNANDGGLGNYNLITECRNKISNSLKGRKRPPISDETRAKMSIAQKNKKPPSLVCKLLKLHRMTLIYDGEEGTIYECLHCGKVKKEYYDIRNVYDERLYRKH